jgi:hypothetical protein
MTLRRLIRLTRQVIAVVLALAAWTMATPDLTGRLQAGMTAAAADTEPELEEALDFYQYIDDDGGIHFVDDPAKVPRRYRSRTVVRKETQAARQTTRVIIHDSLVYVPVTFSAGDRSVKTLMLLDTGSSTTCITEEVATRLRLDLRQTRPVTTRVADGRVLPLRLVTIDDVSVGARRVAPLEIGILPHEGDPQRHDGLLGFDFLSRFQYQLDIPNQLLRWQ